MQMQISGIIIYLIAILMLQCMTAAASTTIQSIDIYTQSTTNHPFGVKKSIVTKRHLVQTIDSLRGGGAAAVASDDEYEYEEEYDEEYDDKEKESSSGVQPSSSSSSTSSTLLKSVFNVCKAVGRAIVAAFQPNDASTKEEGKSFVSTIVATLKRMWKAAMNSESSSSPSSSSKKPIRLEKKQAIPKSTTTSVPKSTTTSNTKNDEKSSKTTPTVKAHDFGAYLSKTYNVPATRNDLSEDDDNNTNKLVPILGGTLSDALAVARSQARLLVVFIPASKPNDKKTGTADKEALSGFLSAEVAAIAERTARPSASKNKAAQEAGLVGSSSSSGSDNSMASFVLWSAKAGSAEATVAMKRLKVQHKHPTKGHKRPILAVVYPATSSGKVVPKLLAQHHCSPPPSAETMAAWLNALRKRHKGQYATMQNERIELELYKQRMSGYKGSVQSDIERKQREQQQEAERKEKERQEKERQAAILKRRQELKENLPDEPEASMANVKTIALRFADGRLGQRRFAADTPLVQVFNWVDAEFEMEREKILLTTLKGDKTFEWNDNDDGSTQKVGRCKTE